MKRFILLLCITTFSFNVENSFSQEKIIIIDYDQLVSVDQVFKIIKEQTEYRFMYPKELFKSAPKVQLNKGEVTVIKLLKQSLSRINFNFEITRNNNIVIKKRAIINDYRQHNKLQKSEIKGSVFDETIGESLPYATVRLIGTEFHTITNEDGRFEFSFDDKIKADSLEFRFLGYETLKIPISFFKTNNKCYLIRNVSQIEEVKISKTYDENYVYNLLFSLIQKYRKRNLTTNSKAFLSLTSSARNVPIEQIEGFYNCKQSLSEGILNLDIKSGRFGQNKSFPFYSLDNTIILEDFKLFEISKQILPLYPGNMTLKSIKSKYLVKVEQCDSCEDKNMQISFKPKKFNGRLFSGKILFEKKDLIIKNIKLEAQNPTTHGLSSIIEKDIITPSEIKLNILFNPLDLDKIQHIDFKFNLHYSTGSSSEYINSHSFLYFYDYEKTFKEPHFTNKVEFRNDYDKIVALQASDEFWNLNYQFPKSVNQNWSMKFMKKHGYLINYDNKIPVNYIKYINPSVISWARNNRLKWESIKENAAIKNTNENLRDYNLKKKMNADDESHSALNSSIAKTNKKKKNELNFSYVLELNENSNGGNEFSTRTIFNRNSSFYNGSESNTKLIYINLMFDLYEYYRLDLEKSIVNNMNYDQAKNICERKFNEASKIVEKMRIQTSSGDNLQYLMNWNNKMKSKMNIDNYVLITKQDD
jgi:hypothetical protein